MRIGTATARPAVSAAPVAARPSRAALLDALTNAYADTTGDSPARKSQGVSRAKLPGAKAKAAFDAAEKMATKHKDDGAWSKAIAFPFNGSTWFAIASSLDGDDTDLRFFSKNGSFAGKSGL